MPLAIRSAVSGLFLATLGAVSEAQMGGGSHHGGSPPSNGAPFAHPAHGPGQGYRGGYAAGGYFGVVSGGYLAVSPPYFIPGLTLPLPVGGSVAGSFFPLLPTGQEGPGGLTLPHPVAAPTTSSQSAPTRRPNRSRSDELIEVGDRSFRGGNYRRAEERYQLAVKANPESPWPHVRLAQIAMVRGDYNKAAGNLRDAVATTRGAGWLLEAPDIQSIFAEPGDFSKQIAHLETYLQAHPNDRNAWFVLGAENYFSGRTRIASDAFLRLTDRSPDAALTAFLDASTVAIRTPATPTTED